MINLPSSGTNNWGAALNNVLNNLDKRLITLEKQNNNFDSNLYAIKQIGCMTSGVADGMYGTLTYSSSSASNYSVSISSDMAVYIGGQVNTYFQPVNRFINSSSFNIPNSGYYYVYLQYDNSTNKFTVVTDTELSFNTNKILIDNIKVNKDAASAADRLTSFGKHFVASKTIAQHRDEQLRRYVEYNGALVPDDNEYEFPAPYYWTPQFHFDSIVSLYADGYYNGNNEVPHTTSQAVTFSSDNCYYLYDTANATIQLSDAVDHTYDLTGGRIFRVLLTVDGCFIIQRANNTTNVYLTDPSSTYESLVRNTSFNNTFPSLSIPLHASDWVEIQRLFVTNSQVYVYAPVNNGYIAGNTGNYYIPSNTSVYLGECILLDNSNTTHGITCNVTNNDETISLDGSKYTTNSIILTNHFVGASVQLFYSGSNGLIIDNDEATLKYGSNQCTVGTNQINLYSTGSISIGTSSTTAITIQGKDITANKITLSDGMYMSSDRRLKENILPVMEDYLAVINDVPVCKYTYINSDDPQIGIIAQDLEKYIGENYFIDNSEEYKKLRENKLIYILWKALQEEFAARQKLEARVNMLMGD